MFIATVLLSGFSFGVLLYKKMQPSLAVFLFSILSSFIYASFLLCIALIINAFLSSVLTVVPIYFLVWSLFQDKARI